MVFMDMMKMEKMGKNAIIYFNTFL